MPSTVTVAASSSLSSKIQGIIEDATTFGDTAGATRKVLDLLGPLADVRRELDHAYAKHGTEQWGRHEFYAILKEEVDELWDAIKADEPLDRVRAEAIQVAAMPVRYLETGDRYGWS